MRVPFQWPGTARFGCLCRTLADHDLGRNEGPAGLRVRTLGIPHARPVRKQADNSRRKALDLAHKVLNRSPRD